MYNEKKNKNAGIIKVSSLKKDFTFTQLLVSGLDFSIVFCIDFSEKSGCRKKFRHQLNDKRMNLYQSLCTNFYNILHYYDRDRLIPIFGINGQPYESKITKQFFPLRETLKESFSKNVMGLNEIYEKSVNHIKEGDEMVVTPSIFKLLETSRKEFKYNILNYFIAIYVIRNQMEDLDMLIHSFKDLSSEPLSVVIIGIGESEEEFMDLKLRLKETQTDFCKKSILFFFYNSSKYENIEDFCYSCLNHLPQEILKFYLELDFEIPFKPTINYSDFIRKSKISKFSHT